MSTSIDSIEFFDGLASEMNSHPERYEILGDVDIDMGIVMHRPGGDFRARLRLEGIECTGVGPLDEGDESAVDCWLDGDLGAWQEMFENIRANGRATGQLTINSLTMLARQIHLRGDDPMGVDKFSRFNQTLQELFDGAARSAAAPVG